jgi:DNA polymerase-3 subunit delta
MLIFLYGEESYQIEGRLRELKARFRSDVDPQGQNIVELDGEKLSFSQLNEAAGAVSMFAKRRFILLNNIFKHKAETEFKKITEYLKKIAGGDHIIVVTDSLSDKELAKLPKYKKELFDFCLGEKLSTKFAKLRPSELINWIRATVSSSGGEISNDAISLLMSLSADNLWQVSQELAKLEHYKLGQAQDEATKGYKIEMVDVKTVVSGQYVEHIFALTDALGERRRERVIKLLEEELLAGQDPEMVFYMVMRQVRTIMLVRDALDRGMSESAVAEKLKLHGFILKKVVGQARNFRVEVLKNMFTQLVKLEYQFKTGQMDLVTGLGAILSKI